MYKGEGVSKTGHLGDFQSVFFSMSSMRNLDKASRIMVGVDPGMGQSHVRLLLLSQSEERKEVLKGHSGNGSLPESLQLFPDARRFIQCHGQHGRDSVPETDSMVGE